MKSGLLVTNLAARTVSEHLKQVIIKALSADLKLEVADTQARQHATQLAREAAERGFDVVISFGGDGTMNEVANGLVGSNTALAVLPGGMANVLCRVLGIPTDIVEATGYLLNRIQSARVRQINVGRMDDRYFVMSCGAGLDAATVKAVEENPVRKRRYKEWFFLSSVLKMALREYRGKQPTILLDAGGVAEPVILAVVTNIPQLTYWKRFPITVAPQADLDLGLDVLAARRLPFRYIPGLAWSLFHKGSHVNWKQIVYLHDVDKVRMESQAEPFPTQVDGEYVGDLSEVTVELISDGLNLLD